MFRLQNNVPNVYVDFSRDFQLLCRLYDVVNASVREEVDSIGRLTDTKFIQSNVLELLQTKLGFFTKKQFSDRELRFVLSAFPILLKNKGTKKGIEETVNIWINLNHFNGNTAIRINNNNHIIYIQFQNDFNLVYDFSILEEVLKYILPTGYFLNISVIASLSIGDNYSDEFGSLKTEDVVNLYTNASNDSDNEIESNSIIQRGYQDLKSIITNPSWIFDTDPIFDFSLITVLEGTYNLTFTAADPGGWKTENDVFYILSDFGITNESQLGADEGDKLTIEVEKDNTINFSHYAVDTTRIESYGNEDN